MFYFKLKLTKTKNIKKKQAAEIEPGLYEV